jgi:hypothetical protein
MSATKIGTAATYQAQPTTFVVNTDGTSKTYSWRGDYAALVTYSASFSVGLVYNNLYIRTVELTPEDGGLATLKVTCDNYATSGGSGTTPVYEVEWQRVDKDIRNHPYWAALLDVERDAIFEWEQDSNKTTKGAKYTALSNLAKSLAQRIAKGETHYMIFVPVARRTTYFISYTILPSTCGKQEIPPAGCNAPAGYTYVKMADKLIKRATGYERCEEWVGFDAVDTILFPPL